MAKRANKNKGGEGHSPSEDKLPATQSPESEQPPVEHPRSMPRKQTYKNRMLLPERINGYDIKKG